MIARQMQVDFFAKTKTNMDDLPLSHRTTIEFLKIVRFQSLNFTSEPKGGVANGKCETLRDGETSVFLCEPETF